MNGKLQKQLDQDLKDYADNAYKLYEVPFKTKGLSPMGLPDNNAVIEYFDEVRRKESAALPFDLERAKAGDEVEIYTLRGWVNCGSKTFEKRKYPLIQLDNISVSVYSLRMKLPPKVKP